MRYDSFCGMTNEAIDIVLSSIDILVRVLFRTAVECKREYNTSHDVLTALFLDMKVSWIMSSWMQHESNNCT